MARTSFPEVRRAVDWNGWFDWFAERMWGVGRQAKVINSLLSLEGPKDNAFWINNLHPMLMGSAFVLKRRDTGLCLALFIRVEGQRYVVYNPDTLLGQDTRVRTKLRSLGLLSFFEGPGYKMYKAGLNFIGLSDGPDVLEGASVLDLTALRIAQCCISGISPRGGPEQPYVTKAHGFRVNFQWENVPPMKWRSLREGRVLDDEGGAVAQMMQEVQGVTPQTGDIRGLGVRLQGAEQVIQPTLPNGVVVTRGVRNLEGDNLLGVTDAPSEVVRYLLSFMHTSPEQAVRGEAYCGWARPCDWGEEGDYYDFKGIAEGVRDLVRGGAEFVGRNGSVCRRVVLRDMRMVYFKTKHLPGWSPGMGRLEIVDTLKPEDMSVHDWQETLPREWVKLPDLVLYTNILTGETECLPIQEGQYVWGLSDYDPHRSFLPHVQTGGGVCLGQNRKAVRQMVMRDAFPKRMRMWIGKANLTSAFHWREPTSEVVEFMGGSVDEGREVERGTTEALATVLDGEV